MAVPTNLGYGLFDLIGGGPSTSTIIVEFTFIPEQIPRVVGPGGLTVYTEPVAWFRWKFTRVSDGLTWFTNWQGINTNRFGTPALRQDEDLDDDIEIFGQAGVEWQLTTGVNRMNRS